MTPRNGPGNAPATASPEGAAPPAGGTSPESAETELAETELAETEPAKTEQAKTEQAKTEQGEPEPAAADTRPAGQAGLTLDGILGRLEKVYGAGGFTADFMQESTLEALQITDMADGRVFVKPPDRMRWEYLSPEQQVIITDGRNLWIHRPADNQLLTGEAPAFFGSGRGASFLSDIGMLRDSFAMERMESEDPAFHWLALTPLEKTYDIATIRIAIDRESFRINEVMTVNTYGDTTRIVFTALNFDKPLDPALFEITVPPGTDVLRIDEP